MLPIQLPNLHPTTQRQKSSREQSNALDVMDGLVVPKGTKTVDKDEFLVRVETGQPSVFIEMPVPLETIAEEESEEDEELLPAATRR